MKRLAVAALVGLAAGCGGGPSSSTVPFSDVHATRVVPPVADRHPYGDVTRVRVGQWARYREADRLFTIAAVAKEGDDVWIEVLDEGDDRQGSARLVDPDGTVKKAFFREFGKDGPGRVVPQPLEQAPPRPKALDGAREGGEEKIKVDGRELTAKLVRIRTETLEGRLAEEVSLWHPDVPPLYAGSADGGLVLRRTGSWEIQLLSFGIDAKPLVAPAEK